MGFGSFRNGGFTSFKVEEAFESGCKITFDSRQGGRFEVQLTDKETARLRKALEGLVTPGSGPKKRGGR